MHVILQVIIVESMLHLWDQTLDFVKGVELMLILKVKTIRCLQDFIAYGKLEELSIGLGRSIVITESYDFYHTLKHMRCTCSSVKLKERHLLTFKYLGHLIAF